MPQSNKDIALTIRRLAKERSVTVKQTLDDCKINRNFLYDLEKGNSSPSVDKLTRIADFLDAFKKLSPSDKQLLIREMTRLLEE